MRTREHYENMLKDNPGTTWGLSLAAQAVYAARTGRFDHNADDYDQTAYRAIYLRLQTKYGEVLNPDEVRDEMSLVSVMSRLGSRTSEKKAAASRKNAQLGGRPKGSGGLTDLQRQAWDLREQGLSINEIGIRMDRQPENIRQLLARAQNKIGRG
jgi:DNA-binding CsgD family transcriptional regulator